MRDHNPDFGYVYCALASNGAVKVGMSINPKARRQTLRSSLRVAMLSVDDFCQSGVIIRPAVAESALIDMLKKEAVPISGWEWFVDADYQKLKRIVSSLRSTERQRLAFQSLSKREKGRRYDVRHRARRS